MPRELDYPLVTKLLGRAFGVPGGELEASFAPATSNDLDELLSLRADHDRTEHRSGDRRYLEWRYDLSGETPGRAIWVFRRSGELVGTLGVEEDVFSHAGTDVTVHKLMDILAREDHMGSGLGVWMNLRLQTLFENTLCIGSTQYSHSIVTKLNTALPDWQTWRYPMRLGYKHRSLARLDPLLRFKRAIFRSLVRNDVGLVRSDRALAGLSELRASMCARRIMPSRSAGKTAWRLDGCPDAPYEHFALATPGGDVTASIVVRRSGGRAELSDALVSEARGRRAATRTLSDLLTLVATELASEGIEVLGTRVNDPYTVAALRRTGFLRRPEPLAMGYRFGSEALTAWMDAGVPLFLMPVDSDFG